MQKIVENLHFKCSLHRNQKAEFVCLNDACLSHNILCFDCYCKEHLQHNKISLLKFITELLAKKK